MATDVTTGQIQSRKDFNKTPSGQYKYWHEEIKSSEKNLANFRKLGSRIVQRYKGGTQASRDAKSPDERGGNFKLNLFNTNVTTLESMMYGRIPKVEVSRRHADPDDDVGRVASNILNRILNNDIQDHPDTYNSVLKAVLQDRLLPGLGVAKVRYEVETETEEENERVVSEEALIEYFHWRDVCWGWGRTFGELPWLAFKSYLSKDEVEKRFGKPAAEGVELKNQTVTTDKSEVQQPDEDGPWKKAEIWEIWDKQKRKVVWVSLGYDKVLDTKKDFLELEGFFPSPPFMVANPTTSLYTPVSDYYISQDLYNEIDTLQTRISTITEAVKVVGVYDTAAAPEVGRMFKEGTDNDLIPVDNWAMFAEKGGIAGVVDWLPIAEITEALGKLIELRDQNIELLQQTTGMSDIMRGQLTGQYEGVGQSQMKAKYGSIRIQALQEEFAQFASNLVGLKAEIISKHFEMESIAKLAGVVSMQEADKDLILPAIKLIKDFQDAKLRVSIKSESMAMIDYQELQQKRTSFLTAIGEFVSAAAPLIEMEPAATPFLMKLMQWGLAGYKGADEIEGVIDQAVQMAEQQAKKPDKPDPEKARAEGAMALENMKHQNNMKEIQAKAEADAQTRAADMQADTAKIRADLQADLTQIVAKMKADIQTEALTSETNAQQNTAAVQNEITKDAIATENEISKEAAKTELKIKEIGAQNAVRSDDEK